ncbi:hypothetical protein [Jiella pelagia]|uniref:hypothetical protein n=1 Tax=Jiella pelagia TaxID=2986949 RepID=UPI0022A7FAF4|nr:hypothetical protein [Jiella pelagia]
MPTVDQRPAPADVQESVGLGPEDFHLRPLAIGERVGQADVLHLLAHLPVENRILGLSLFRVVGCDDGINMRLGNAVADQQRAAGAIVVEGQPASGPEELNQPKSPSDLDIGLHLEHIVEPPGMPRREGEILEMRRHAFDFGAKELVELGFRGHSAGGFRGEARRAGD